MPERKNFTKAYLKSLPVPENGKRLYFYDEKVHSLILGITATGNKSFQVRKKINGRSVRVTLGKFPAMTIEQARKQANAEIAKMEGGINPNAEKRQFKANLITLKTVFEDYLKARKSLKAGTIKDYTRAINEGYGDWLTKPLKNITRDMVSRRHNKRGQVSQARANNEMRVLRALFNFASGEYENNQGTSLFPDNPVTRISHTRAWYRVERKQSIIKPYEFKPWFDAVLNLPEWYSGKQADTVKDYLILSLLTGLRRTEASTLKWGNIDFKQNTLTVADTKNHDSHTLPMSGYLISLLQKRKLKAINSNDSNYLFEGSGKYGYLTHPDSIVKQIREKTGIQFSPHDLRRTFITVAESLDISAYALKKLVNHRVRDNDVTAGYIIMDVERLRKPMQAITDYILAKAEIKEGAKIIEFPASKLG